MADTLCVVSTETFPLILVNFRQIEDKFGQYCVIRTKHLTENTFHVPAVMLSILFSILVKYESFMASLIDLKDI